MWRHLVVPTIGRIRKLPDHRLGFLFVFFFHFRRFVESITLHCVIYIYLFFFIFNRQTIAALRNEAKNILLYYKSLLSSLHYKEPLANLRSFPPGDL